MIVYLLSGPKIEKDRRITNVAFRFQFFGSCNVIGQLKGRQKTNVYGWVSDLAVARSGFNQIGCFKAIQIIFKPCIFLRRILVGNKVKSYLQTITLSDFSRDR